MRYELPHLSNSSENVFPVLLSRKVEESPIPRVFNCKSTTGGVSSHRDTALDAPWQNHAYDETPCVPGLGFHVRSSS